jgi:hypothetical protein
LKGVGPGGAVRWDPAFFHASYRIRSVFTGFALSPFLMSLSPTAI